MTEPGDGGRPGRRRCDRYLSVAVLVLLVVAWLALFATLPKVAARTLTFDIACRSGNEVVGVWVENSSGGSSWAQRGDSSRSRFVYQQSYDGGYEVRVGCGGTEDHWGVEARSTVAGWSYRRLFCDDVDFLPPKPALCKDELTG
jgi:hypothetical protein